MNTIDVHIPGAFQPAAWYILRLLQKAAWKQQPDVAFRLAGEIDPGAIHVNQRGPESSAMEAVAEMAHKINRDLAAIGPDAWLRQNGVGDHHTRFDVTERNQRMQLAQRQLIERALPTPQRV